MEIRYATPEEIRLSQLGRTWPVYAAEIDARGAGVVLVFPWGFSMLGDEEAVSNVRLADDVVDELEEGPPGVADPGERARVPRADRAIGEGSGDTSGPAAPISFAKVSAAAFTLSRLLAILLHDTNSIFNEDNEERRRAALSILWAHDPNGEALE